MALLTKEAFDTKYTDAATGLYKTGQVLGIGSDDHRTLVQDLRDSVMFISGVNVTTAAAGFIFRGADNQTAFTIQSHDEFSYFDCGDNGTNRFVEFHGGTLYSIPGNLGLFGATTFDTGSGVLAIFNAGTVPAAGDANQIMIYAKDVAASSELFVKNEAGVETQLSGTHGTYTPTLTNVANLAASTAYACQYMRVGNVVTVSGRVDVDPTATGLAQLGISLPIASNLALSNQCGGAAFSSAVAGQGAAVVGDITNNRAEMQWIAVDVANRDMFFTFTYLII